MKENCVEIKDLVKQYDDKFILGPININIKNGKIVGIIGENGAGKTTLIKSILNIIKANSGNINMFDKDYIKYEKEIKEDVGVVLDDMFFPEVLTPAEISIVMKDIYKNWDKSLFENYIKEFNLSMNEKIKTFSKGMRKKLEIATALAHKPKLLILDEPTSGLDPIVRNEVLDIFQKFISDNEHTILLSTHITSDLEHIADDIIFINKGKIIMNKPTKEIIQNYGILTCSKDYIGNIAKEDITAFKENKNDYQILVEDKKKISEKYKDQSISNVNLEDLMVLIIKGEK